MNSNSSRLAQAFLALAMLLSLATLAPAAFADTPLLLRNPSLSADKIAFLYADDVWTVSRQGGEARRLTSVSAVVDGPFFSLAAPSWTAVLPRQHLLEQHEVVPAVGIPAHADDVIFLGNAQVKHRTMLVVTLEANGIVIVEQRPAMHRVHQLRRDPLPAKFRQHTIEPRKEDARFQLEPERKANGVVVDTGHHLQHVMTAEIPPLKSSTLIESVKRPPIPAGGLSCKTSENR